jgi:integrase
MADIHRIKGKPGDQYEVLFVDQHGHLIVALTEWYRLRSQQGPTSTRDTYLTCLLPFFAFLAEKGCSWNASPSQLRTVLIEFHRERLGCLIHPGKDRESIEIVPTRHTPLRESTLRVLRAALRDFYLVMKDEGLYAFPNPLACEMLMQLKRLRDHTIANAGAPDHAGIRGESHERSRRQPTAFIRHPKAAEWKPNVRKELADVRAGMHAVLDAMIDSRKVSLREKAVLELLQNTGARLHEIVLLTVGGYRNDGIAGQAHVVNKGSYGRESKTIYFAHNPTVQQILTTYLEQVRPLHDPKGRTRLTDVSDTELLFLTERGTSYSVKSFYYHWYRHYPPLRALCPVPFSPHDIRHLFISEFLMTLCLECGAGTEHMDTERYQREREAFGSTIMGWRSSKTIDIYDHSRDGEHTLEVLARMQQGFSQRRFVFEPPATTEAASSTEKAPQTVEQQQVLLEVGETMWLHDAETLAWVKKMQQHSQHL